MMMATMMVMMMMMLVTVVRWRSCSSLVAALSVHLCVGASRVVRIVHSLSLCSVRFYAAYFAR